MDTQDIRKMGSLNLFLPFTYLVFLFGSLSLMAFPFTSGWYSKD
jgi:NADH:ubiquinone oxidoreductase subunit 5 (subunit L)/multisubunit Na+/H+ antiporter MnhA subunit